MNFYQVYPKGFASNTYVLEKEKRCIVIDPGQPRVAAWLAERGFAPAYVLLTHGHFDHIGGVAALQEAGAKVGCLAAEKDVALGSANLAAWSGGVPSFSVDFTFEEGEMALLGETVRVIAAPGHTQGGCCYLIDGRLFTGDTLFCESAGRTDLPTGDGAKLRESLRKLFAMEGDYPVYPGHEEETTLAHERKYNPFR